MTDQMTPEEKAVQEFEEAFDITSEEKNYLLELFQVQRTQAAAEALKERDAALAHVAMLREALGHANKIAKDFLHMEYGERRLGTLLTAWLGSFGNMLTATEAREELAFMTEDRDREQRAAGFYHDKVAGLEAEVERLQAANRVLVEAVESLRPDHTHECIGRMMICKAGQEECLCGADTGMQIADKALSTPHAKRAAAQAEVLRAAREFVRTGYAPTADGDLTNQGKLTVAVEALEAAENGEDNAGYCDVYF